MHESFSTSFLKRLLINNHWFDINIQWFDIVRIKDFSKLTFLHGDITLYSAGL